MLRKMMFTCLALSSILLTSVFGQQPKKLILNLKQCEKLAFENNQIIKNAELDLEFSRARKTQASHARILPKLELKNIWGPSPRARGVFTKTGVLTSPDTSTGLSDLRYFTEVEFNLVQPIFTFGKLSGLNLAASYGVEADEANIRAKRADVQLKVRQLYWGLILGEELLAVVEDAVKEVNDAEQKLQQKFDEGSEDVTQNDLFKLQIFKYDIDKRHREALNKIDMARATLRTVLGLQKNVYFDLDTKYLDPIHVRIDSLPVYLELALENRPEIYQLQAGVSARRALIGVSKSDYFPQFFFAGQIKYNFAKDRFDPNNPFVYNPTNFFRPGFLVGLNMNLNFVQTRDKVRIAQAEYQKLSQKETLLQSGIKLQVRQAYLDLVQAQKNMRESRRALKASESWLRSVAMTFDVGIAEVKEFIDAFKANSTMKGDHLQNIFKFNTSVAKLSSAVGRDLTK